MRLACNLAFAAALVSTLGAPRLAAAQDDLEEARSRFELAEGHFRDGDFALALTEFERVHALMSASGHPNAIYVVYNIAVTNEQLGRDRAAIETYERFLRESAPDAPNRADAESRLRELRERMRLAEQDAASEADVEPAPAATGGGGVSPVGVIVAAVGGAALVAGAVVGGLALSDSDAARADCVDSVCPSSARDGIAGAQTMANVADGLLFGGAAVAATGVVLMLVLSDGEAPPVSAACSATGCHAVVRGTF